MARARSAQRGVSASQEECCSADTQGAYEGEGPGFAVKLVGTEQEPVLTAACDGETITVPMDNEFAAFVLLKD